MDSGSAREIVAKMRDSETGAWHDSCKIATTTFRSGVVAQLSRDPELTDDVSITLAEIHLTDELPDIESFDGIHKVDNIGIWYYDGDGGIDDPVWRQRLIPWAFVKTVVLHQSS